MKESANLDLLRSFAVLCVFVTHLVNNFGSRRFDGVGRLGVLLFFVHTSYVLLLSLRRNGESWASFQVRRIFRIYPLAVCAFLIYFVFRPLQSMGGPLEVPVLSRLDILSNLLLIQNITHSLPLPAMMWSLPFELQMYLVLPFVCIACVRFGRIGAIALYFAVVVLVVLCGVGLLKFVPCFMVGAFLFTAKRVPMLHWSAFVALLSLLAVVSTSALMENLLTQWLICLAVAFSIPRFIEIQSRTFVKMFATIAKYSYGIYLFHWMAMRAAVNVSVNARTFVLLSVVFTAVASFAAFHLIEDPMIKTGKRIIAANNSVSEIALMSSRASS